MPSVLGNKGKPKLSKYNIQKCLNINKPRSVETRTDDHLYNYKTRGLESLLEIPTQSWFFRQIQSAGGPASQVVTGQICSGLWTVTDDPRVSYR